MWFLGRKLLEYLSDEKIALEKREEVFNKRHNQVVKEFEKLTDLEVINYLFKSSLPHDVKVLICHEVDKLYRSDANNIRYKNIKTAFIRRYSLCEDVLKLDFCPSCLKRIVINNIYGNDIIGIIKDNSIDISKRKAIIETMLSIKSSIELLSEELDDDLIDFIIDSKIISNDTIKACLNNRKLSADLKEKIVARRVTMKNLFLLTKYCTHKDREFIFRIKEKELEDYIVDLDSSNVLDAINSFPRDFTKKIVDLNREDIIDAIMAADKSLIESCLFYEKDVEVVKLILEYRNDTVFEILSELHINKLLSFLKTKYLPQEYKLFIMEKHRDDLEKKIKSLSLAQVGFFYLTNTSFLPSDVKENMFDVHKEAFKKKFMQLSEDNVFNELRFGSYDILLKRLLVDVRIDESNVFKLLEIADETIAEIIFDLKVDLIRNFILRV